VYHAKRCNLPDFFALVCVQRALIDCGGAAAIRNALCANPDGVMVHLLEKI
jgi:hypothetical protein